MLYVLDASAIVRFKTIISVGDQWGFFQALAEVVADGMVIVPRAVAREVRDIPHPDMPGAWAAGVFQSSPRSLEPAWDAVEFVMATAPNLVDPDAVIDPADPYVIALALDLLEEDEEVTVVTDDHIDHNPRISLATACELCDVDCISAAEFAERVQSGRL